MYKAICLYDPSLNRDGFSSLELAHLYIASFICKTCEKDLENGGYPLDDYGEFVKVENVLQTDCGAGWRIEYE